MEPFYEKMRFYWGRVLAFLRVGSIVAGLEISDQVVRLMYFDGKVSQLHAVRLSPNILEKGRIKDAEAFRAALVALKGEAKIGGRDKKRRINVVVALSSSEPYSKVFKLPTVGGDDLQQAVALNLQMASPGTASEMYSSWQIVGRDESANQLEILSSFVDRTLVDELVDALFSVGFLAVAVEPKALALARVFRKMGSGIDLHKAYILASIDNSGLEFLIIRGGEPYFEYVNRWRDIMDDKGSVSLEVFEEGLKTSLRQVLNFYAQQWSDPIAGIILSTVAFQEEVEKTIAANFTFPVVRLTLLMGQQISSEWLVALGSSLRSTHFKAEDHEVSFLGEELEDRFREDQVLRFLSFWRVVVPAVFGILVGVFFITEAFLGRTQAAIESAPAFTLIPSQNSEAALLQASTTIFNDKVAMIGSLEASTDFASVFMSRLYALAGNNGVTVSRLTFSALGSPIHLNGTALSEDNILAFKAAMGGNANFSAISLPLTGVQAVGAVYGFSMTFTYVP